MGEALHIVDIGGDVAKHAHVLRVEHHAADVLQRVVPEHLRPREAMRSRRSSSA